ncbi:SusC/RagA family TonB-linked outer membrane protein [Catalinimonas niigatensis]|uniref:SusC/RagA family TonB-linked outer membrane protein n=1 Tax=Catalinimonas niigatensis TaxID=1397264 RepID=UPI002666104B|nr:SusC/RagA family TonB-linked outer membrane protein [Catalinimonas niigatensis]WPP50731.1 SusC/RagA family TonB-linked outer membrane protein [Catalinimonas niigatensis]
MNRLFMSILVVFSLHVGASAQLAFNERLPTGDQDNQQSLKSVLLKFETKHKVSIIFQDQDVKNKTVDESHLDYQKLEETLHQVLKPLGLKYEKVKNNVFVIQETEASQQIKKVENKRISSSDLTQVDQLILPAPQLYFNTYLNNNNNSREQSISGTVTDMESGEGLPGVNILAKGTSSGTVTDISGNYKISVGDEVSTLVFSSIGYTTEEVSINGRNVIDVVLSQDIQSLSEVVVTALGIERKREALAYSVSEVQGEEFTQAREPNVANALTGKVAGVNATGMATGPGGSSRVIIRGNGSLVGDNQPLYVVNGMPIDNSIPGGGSTTDGQGINVDRGDGIAGINPDDIETISVLKGGAAAALYGSRAANGVILITTKRGKGQEGIGVEYNTNLTFDTPSMFPDFQYEYGQGFDGRKPLTQAEALSSGRLSYGAPMDGQPSIQFDGVERPYSPVNVKDNIKNFYRTGTTFVNTVALSGGSDNVNFRLSLSDMDVESVVPNSNFNRKTTNLNLNAFLGKKLSFETVVQYNFEQANNRPGTGYADYNAGWATHLVANTVDIRSLAPGYDENGREIEWNPVPVANNAYWVVNRYHNNDEKNRFIGQANLQYDILDNLNIRGSVSRDFYNFDYVGITPYNTAFEPQGRYESLKADVSETNAMLTLNYNTAFLNNFNINAMVGGNRQKGVNNSTAIDGSQFTIPYFYSYTNLATLTTIPSNRVTATNSLFGSADLDYKGIVYLTLTGRQDWFSTLSPENNSIFYPSIGGSFILSEAVDLPNVIDFVKLRGSWAQVGGATPDPYLINQTFDMVQGGHNGRPVQAITTDLVTNPDLRPLTSTTYEAGIDVQLMESRLGIDLTFYDRTTTDDIVQTNISEASGYRRALLNVGELNNRGVELLLTGSPVRSSNFNWNVSYNMAYNDSKIVKLAEGLNTVQVGSGIGGGSIQNEIGRPYGIIKGYRIRTDENGQTVFNANSGYEARSEIEELGLGVPPLTMGLTNDFRYKNFSLNVLLDGKFGNSIYSNLAQYSHRFGLTKATLPGRENGLQLSGVDEEGNPYERVVPVEELDTYYDNHKNYTDIFVYNGSFIKLRQLIFSYKLPVDKLSFIKLQSASISLVGRNLAILYKHTDLFDPESSYTNGNAQGLEAFGVPRTRSFGVNLMVKF